MSTLSVTNLTTANSTTDLSIFTGNTSNPSIVLSAANGSLTAYGVRSLSNTGTGLYAQSNTGTVATFANATTTFATIPAGGGLNLALNNTKLSLSTVNAATSSYFIQQNDDNFVFYSTNTAYQPRAIWSIYANSVTSNLNVSVPMQVSSNLTVTTNTFNLGTSSITANGYTRLPNGLLMQWGSVGGSSGGNTITFPTAFTGAIYSITATAQASGAGNTATITAANTTTFKLTTTQNGGLAYWQAIGN